MRDGAVFITLSLAACGGKSSSGFADGGGGRSNGGESGTSGQSAGANSGTGGESSKLDSGSAGEPPSIDAGSEEERLHACKHAFAVEHSARCGGPVLPSDEAARAAALFEQDCMNQFALRGNGVTAAALEACATATEAAACQTPDGPPPECDLRGLLPGGAPCIVKTQCESGSCVVIHPPGGFDWPAECSRCGPVVRVGEPCPQGGCPRGSLCINTKPDAPSYLCVALILGEQGASCDGLTAICQRGLYCDGQSKRCAPLGDVGQPCGSKYPTGCKPPLICSGAPGTCKVPGEIGAPCQNHIDCAAELVCAYQEKRCAPVTWVAPGGFCDDVQRCLQGSCGANGPLEIQCPLIRPDGASCAPNQNACDEASVCFDGTCRPLHSIRCE